MRRMSGRPIVTFTSDFGNREYYVAAVKAVILSGCPEANIVDISHRVASHDLLEAAFTLACAYPFFPPRTIHLVVVDPGVGSSRRAIIADATEHLFVAPDNGVLSLVYDQTPISRVVSIEEEHHFRQPVAPTFHGRDIFAPVVGQLARGLKPTRFGPAVTDFVRLNLPPVSHGSDAVEGIVLHVDKFGNLITSIRPEDLEAAAETKATPGRLRVNGRDVTRQVRYFSEGEGEELFYLVGSTGRFEVASWRRPAAQILQAKRGMPVQLSYAIEGG